MVTIKILLLLTVLGGLFGGCRTVVADGNKEHVHIKVHVPQLIKKHTHVRTIYKHHFKTNHMKQKKGKHSYRHAPTQHSYYDESPSQYYGQDRRDPDVRRAHSPTKHQKWMDQLVAAESLVNNAREHSASDSAYSPTNIAQTDADILSEWQHNFEQLNRKPATPSIPAKRTKGRNKQQQQRTSTKTKSSSSSSAEINDRPSSKLPTSGPSDVLDYRYFDSLSDGRSLFHQPTTDKRPTAHKVSISNQYAEPNSKTSHRSEAKIKNVRTTNRPKSTSRNPIDHLIPTNHSPQHRILANQMHHNLDTGSQSYYHSTGFRPPPLLKITEDDIRSPPQTSVRSKHNNNKPKSSNGRNKKKESIEKPHSTNTFDHDGLRVIETSDWGGYATEIPVQSYHSFPSYMQTVSGAMQYNQPIVAEPDDFSDNYRPQFTSISAPSGPGAPMSLALQMSPAQRANKEDEEFRPFKGSVQMSYIPSDKGLKYSGANEGQDESLENAGDSEEKDERNIESKESSEQGPMSFDEVPYQTFTKRKNLLRNAHRE